MKCIQVNDLQNQRVGSGFLRAKGVIALATYPESFRINHEITLSPGDSMVLFPVKDRESMIVKKMADQNIDRATAEKRVPSYTWCLSGQRPKEAVPAKEAAPTQEPLPAK